MSLRARKKAVYAAHSFRPGEDERRVKTIVKVGQGFKGERLLDIGCGDGRLAVLIAQAIGAKKVFGVDISPRALDEAREKGITAFELDIDDAPLPFPDESFDVVFSGNLIHHLYDPDHLLDEMYRVLKPNGVGMLSNRNRGAWHNRLALLLGYQPFIMSSSLTYVGAGKLFMPERGSGGHLGGFTFRALKRLLELHRFRILSVHGTWNEARPPFPRWVYLANKVVNAFLGGLPSLAPFTIFCLIKDTHGRATTGDLEAGSLAQ